MMRGRLIDTQGSATTALPLEPDRYPDHLLEHEPHVFEATCPACVGEGWTPQPGSAYRAAIRNTWHPHLDAVLSPCTRCCTRGTILDHTPPLPQLEERRGDASGTSRTSRCAPSSTTSAPTPTSSASSKGATHEHPRSSPWRHLHLKIEALPPGIVTILFQHLTELLEKPDMGDVQCELSILLNLDEEQHAKLKAFLESGWFSYGLTLHEEE